MSYESEWIVCLIQRRSLMVVRESYEAASRALRRRANALIWG